MSKTSKTTATYRDHEGFRVTADGRMVDKTWPEAHANDPKHTQPGGFFGCPLCINARSAK